MNKTRLMSFITLLFVLSNLCPAFSTPEEVAEIKQAVTTENIITRTELTAYTDRKIGEMIQRMQTDGQNMINKNFYEFDQRMQNLANLILIKLFVGIVSAIVLGCTIAMWINRILNRREAPAPAVIFQDPQDDPKTGLLTPQFKERSAAQNFGQTNFFDSPTSIPRPPTIPEILAAKREQELKAEARTTR